MLIIISCNQQTVNNKDIQNKLDSLQNQIKNSYKPGFGEFMSMIQLHHSKLWFAGKEQNWKLADFEIHEIMESIEDIKKYEKDRTETQLITMIQPAIDSLSVAIKEKNLLQFKKNFQLLTNGCNSCHQATKFEFNKITIPNKQIFDNQDFSNK